LVFPATVYCLSRVKKSEDIKFLHPDDRPDGFELADLTTTTAWSKSIADPIFLNGLQFE